MVFLASGSEVGVQLVHKFFRGLEPTNPDYYEFGSIVNTDNISDQLGSMPNPIIRKLVTWSATGSNSLYETTLSTVEAVGSHINIEGLVAGPDVGTGSEYTVDNSVIFDKDSSFFVTIQGELVIKNS